MTDRILAHRHRLVTDENSKLVDARRDVLRAVHDHARQHGRERRAAVDPARPARLAGGARVDVNAYTLTFAVLLVTGGRLGDIFGRRRMFLFGVAVFGLSSLAIGFAPNDTVLVAFRAVQGVGAAFMMPATLAIITQAFPAEQRGTAIGTWAGVSALALAIGPVVGGFLTEYVSWRAIFFINPPIAVVAVAVTLFAARESRDETVGRPSTSPASPR